MKWFRHMTASHTDEKLCAVLDEVGLEGYGFWWILVEVVAGQVGPKENRCCVTYSLPQWSRLLYCHHHKVSKYLGSLQGNGLVTVENVEGKVRVTIPNLEVHISDERRPASDIWRRIRAAIFERDDYTCQYCGEHGGKLECDHVMPVSRGGDHSNGNLVTACFSCNRSKRAKTVEEWGGRE